MARPVHLVRRFFVSLRPGGPGREAEAWVAERLLPGELELWRQMSRPDRRHAYGVARRVEETLGDDATRPVLAAALLHDVGKIDARLRTYGRVVATLSGAIAGREMAPAWRNQTGFIRRVGLYLLHPAIGAERLQLAGADPLTVAWAKEHHLPAEEWTVPPEVAQVLKDCDDD